MKKTAQIIKDYTIGGPGCPAGPAGPAWREKRPDWDRQRCFKCGMCWLACPDAAIVPESGGLYTIISERCKGCGICAAVCWNDTITMTPEQAAPAARTHKKRK